MRLVILGTLAAVLGVSVATLSGGGKGVNFRAVLGDANTQGDYSSYLRMMSSQNAQQELERMKNARDMQELYLRLIKEGGQGTNSSLMLLMQQTLSSMARQQGSDASRGFQQSTLTLEQMLQSIRAQQGSAATSGDAMQLIREMLLKTQKSSSSALSRGSQGTRSQSAFSSAAGTQGLTSSEQELLMRLLLLMMTNSSGQSSPLPSSGGSSLAGSASSVLPAGSYEAYVSSVQSVIQLLSKGSDIAKVREEQRIIRQLTAVQASLATRLTQELTLTQAMREKVHTYVTQELPRTSLKQTAADYVFAGFKLENGQALVAQKYTMNPDIDPKDWYAPAVAYIQYLGLMKGQGDGLFAPTKVLNQAELAVILANAMREQSGGTRPAAAKAGQAFGSWPVWGQSAVVELRGRGVDVTFFTATPLSPVTRLQMSRAIADTLLKGRQTNPEQAKSFADTVRLSPVLKNYVSLVSSYGIMTGKTGGLFDPYGLLSRAEAAKIFGKAIEVKSPVLKGAANTQQ